MSFSDWKDEHPEFLELYSEDEALEYWNERNESIEDLFNWVDNELKEFFVKKVTIKLKNCSAIFECVGNILKCIKVKTAHLNKEMYIPFFSKNKEMAWADENLDYFYEIKTKMYADKLKYWLNKNKKTTCRPENVL